jgi:phosphate:Na+ symporter
MLGADVGTALMTLVFSFDLSWLSPLLIFLGVTLFMRRESSQIGRFGQILIGLGLIILALQLIVLAAQPLTKGAGVKVIFGSLTGDVLLDMLVAAIFTMLSYSSLAVVLLTATLAASKVISLHVALGLVLGANLGSGLLAMLTTLTSSPEARRVTLGNLLFRLLGCIIIVPLLPYIEELFASTPLDDAQVTVYFHLLFNVVIAVGFLFFTEKIARVAERLLPARHDADDPAKARYLDPSALDTPKLAIGNAAREAMRLADFIEQMLNGMLAVLKTNDRVLAEKIRKMDDIVDDLYTAIKLYLTQVSREALDEKEGRRWADIVSFTINMEQVGDIVERVVTDLEEKKIDKGRSFSAAGMQEICDLHGRLIANLRLGMSVFLHADLASAQQLLAEKVLFRDLERAYADSHIERLSINTLQSIETSSLHLDLISDLKRINSHICSIAYPILEQAGVLAKTRLREAPAPPAPPTEEPAAPEGPGSKDSWQKRKPRTA